jgi:hypothetical protein
MPNVNETRTDAIKLLRKRAKTLHKGAIVTIFLIILSLVAGIGVFVGAGWLTSREVSDVTGRGLASHLAIPSSGEQQTSWANLSNTVSELQDRIEIVGHQQFSTYALVSTVSTRVGAALILFFLVQILVSLYRYNAKLAAFYDSRADAILLAGDGDEQVLEKYVKMLSTENFDFGEPPNTPAEHLAEIAKEAVRVKKGQ